MARFNHLLWFDLESTNGEPETDRFLEVGCVLTDSALTEIDTYEAVIDPSPFDWMKRLEEVPTVLEMHVANGLVNDLLSGKGIGVTAAEDGIIAMLDKHKLARGRQVRLSGGGVCHFDRKFITAFMPHLDGILDHRGHDIGDIRRFIHETCNRPDLLAEYDPKTKAHRGLADARQHLEEARHYQSIIKRMPDMALWPEDGDGG